MYIGGLDEKSHFALYLSFYVWRNLNTLESSAFVILKDLTESYVLTIIINNWPIHNIGGFFFENEK